MTASSWTIKSQSARSGWLLYTLLFVAAACLPLSITDSHWLPGAERLLYVVFWSLLAGIILGRSRFPGWLMWVVGMGVGLTYSVQFALRLLPSLSMFLADLWSALSWTWQAIFQRAWTAPFPTLHALVQIATELRLATQAVSGWLAAASAGVVSDDITVLWLLVSFIVWAVCWYAAYEMMRTQRALIALLPLGIAIISNVAVTFIGSGYVHIFAALMLVILVYTNVNRLERIWERLGVDFNAELRRDTLVAGAAISAVVLVFALIVPYTTYNRAVDFFWENYGTRLQRFYDRLDRAFAGRDPVPDSPDAFQEQIIRGLLPHDVGLSGDLPDSMVMLVQISDPPPPPPHVVEQIILAEALDPRRLVERRYWRQRTYDVYTGYGWDTSERNVAELAAQEPWQEPDYPHTVVTQTYTLLLPHSNIVFAINAPTVADHDYRVLYRGEDDLVALSLDQPRYTVVSYAPQPETDDLLAAEGEYPPEIAERYLALPEIPRRVQDLAWEIVNAAGAETRYDKARAIELYLRRFVYDLDVPSPPLDRDITDYFLFDAQRGFCDYSASAMVVMLRSVGVAARYASGYGMGQYDYAQEAWVVTGLNAHAWAEVYFPGLGWIEFEPTPTELPREFVGTPASFRPQQLPELPVRQETAPESNEQLLWVGMIALGLVLAVVLVWARVFRRRQDMGPREQVRRVYDRLLERARWLNLEPRDGQTPQEYLRYLTGEISVRGPYGHTLDDLRLIGDAYMRARYSQAEITDEEGRRVQEAWGRLRGVLARMILARRPERRLAA
jgi:transglutaminase-like putative cysteine protease